MWTDCDLAARDRAAKQERAHKWAFKWSGKHHMRCAAGYQEGEELEYEPEQFCETEGRAVGHNEERGREEISGFGRQ